MGPQPQGGFHRHYLLSYTQQKFLGRDVNAEGTNTYLDPTGSPRAKLCERREGWKVQGTPSQVTARFQPTLTWGLARGRASLAADKESMEASWLGGEGGGPRDLVQLEKRWWPDDTTVRGGRLVGSPKRAGDCAGGGRGSPREHPAPVLPPHPPTPPGLQMLPPYMLRRMHGPP
eukprot:CAMPEP_0114135168 /NCGR_PEP_ID=MMETSP0043_2-20121206/14559_1 /TAXON_ID=464988 /ORGANISM="Hemiselmis andersenii, Strain CCMP644" /LENGTH=173 /DNA_ID=CAMNT_0001228881 /DNA_START=162 /DNA_END=680 /DNA_ORIENTATION=+